MKDKAFFFWLLVLSVHCHYALQTAAYRQLLAPPMPSDGLSACPTVSVPLSSNAAAGATKPSPHLNLKVNIYCWNISFSFRVGFWDIAELAGERVSSEYTSGLICEPLRKVTITLVVVPLVFHSDQLQNSH